ncbi:natterin-3-like [Vespula squamosa]|uniref:Natterin-3-like n=1 Tax=Vespula squamosa TaxID=30214 RepID=A0ABD2C2C2_VESSQ
MLKSSSTFLGYKWVHYPNGPERCRWQPNMITIGRDLDGMNLVVGRARHHGDVLPAKVKPDHSVAYVCHNGNEHMKHEFEILMPTDFKWIPSGHGHVPENAVEAGRTVNGEVLFVGRTYHNGVPCVGKVQRSHGVLYIPYDGQEIPFRQYEVLVQS